MPGDATAGGLFSISRSTRLSAHCFLDIESKSKCFCFSCTTGHVGVPLPCNFVKLVDVEEMNYFASNGEGEVGGGEFIERGLGYLDPVKS